MRWSEVRKAVGGDSSTAQQTGEDFTVQLSSRMCTALHVQLGMLSSTSTAIQQYIGTAMQ